MDQLLSQLIPTQKIGNDGFNWWVGQVEGTATNEPNNKGGTRYKVRIVGEHPQSKELLSTADLPWCSVMMPVNVPFMPGNEGGASFQFPANPEGCWILLRSRKTKTIDHGVNWSNSQRNNNCKEC